MARNARLAAIALVLTALLISLGAVELILRHAVDLGGEGDKVWIDDQGNGGHPELAAAVAQAVRDFPFSYGNCYSTDPGGTLPITVADPQTGRTWHCVAYDMRSRAAGYDPGREYQAAIVGDSFAFGEGVKEEDTLGYLMNRAYPRVNFRSYAASGANVAQVDEMCAKILLLAPNVRSIVYFYNLNDVLMSPAIAERQQFILDFQNLRLSRAAPDQGPLARALAWSRIAALIRRAWVVRRESALTARNYRDMYFSEENRSEFIASMDLLKGISEMARARGVAFAVVVHPLLNKDLLGRYPFEEIHRAVLAACRERGVSCLDGYEPFRRFFSLSSFTVNPVDYHPNGRSNRMLVDYLRGSGFLDDTGRVR